MAILKAFKYEIAKSSEMAKSIKKLKLTFLYKLVLNLLNTFQYKQCWCILMCVKCKASLIDQTCKVY